ncbi:hypothetical protein HNQ44_001707 [Planomicrobium koreense]|uniref:Elongation factor G-binding protein n=1 Tax=Planococcus koreensis TaxID=112331 RepID=A0A7W8FS84_9BACL|nr:FusB/FusC family EF-G-binding protein [Planococcus koreensis]MBB5180279.1 hypothetical protein [Planococcus koreensis]
MIHVKETTDKTGGGSERPEAFIRNDQFNFIKDQAAILVTGQATGNDAEVLSVLRHLAHEKVFKLFPALTEEQKTVLGPLAAVKESADAEAFLEALVPYIIPFPAAASEALAKLFPKAKKLKGPKPETVDFSKMSYLAWTESSNLMYLVTQKDGRLEGVSGTLSRSGKKGVCAICNRHSEVGLFTARTKSSGQDQFVKRGNYICMDNAVCNRNINTLERLSDFTARLQK